MNKKILNLPISIFLYILSALLAVKAEGRQKLAQAKGAFFAPQAWANNPTHNISAEGAKE